MTETITKTRVAPMSMGQKFRLMEIIRNTNPQVPDADLAQELSLCFERPINGQTVARYRKELGLLSVPSLSRAQLRAKLEEAQRLLAIASQGQLHLEGSSQ